MESVDGSSAFGVADTPLPPGADDSLTPQSSKVAGYDQSLNLRNLHIGRARRLPSLRSTLSDYRKADLSPTYREALRQPRGLIPLEHQLGLGK